MPKLSIPSITSGNPLKAALIRESTLRRFFGMAHVRLAVYSQGIMSTKWYWSEGWYHPNQITGYYESKV